MPNGRRVDPVAVLGGGLIAGAIVWWLVGRKKRVRPNLFVVGQRVALETNTLETGTITRVAFGVSGIQKWFYDVLFDSTGTISVALEERFLIAI